MSFERELLKRIPRYEADGLIDRAAAEKLSAHLRALLEGKKPVFFNAVYFAGVILLIVSSSQFVQNIWDELSAGMRLLLAFVPLVISATFGVCALLLRLHPLLREAAAVANILSAGAMLCLFAGVFDTLFTCACFAAVGIHAFRNRAEPVRGQASRAIAAAIRG